VDPDTSSETGNTGDGGDTSSGPGTNGADNDTTCTAEDEVCNGVDDDCDGDVDEDDLALGLRCDTDLEGPCGTGTLACTEGELVCTTMVRPSEEVCDEIDNDCDGFVDNGLNGARCNTGFAGTCAVGVNMCRGRSLVCTPVGIDEVCNGEDDDCDGNIDNGDPGGGEACRTELSGPCAAGTLTCALGRVECTPDVRPADEVCGNLVDDNCNGALDETCVCPHELCVLGDPMQIGCDDCVNDVCAAMPACCEDTWDEACTGIVDEECDLADCIDPACAHSVCDTGVQLDDACHPCVAAVCSFDFFCCSGAWDSLCVMTVGMACGLGCSP
jgi:hypothetical protein